MLLQPDRLVSPLSFPPQSRLCSLLSGLLTLLFTHSQGQCGLLYAESDCFWLLVLTKALPVDITKACFASGMGVLSKSMGVLG